MGGNVDSSVDRGSYKVESGERNTLFAFLIKNSNTEVILLDMGPIRGECAREK
jgi:hypothetical protein